MKGKSNMNDSPTLPPLIDTIADTAEPSGRKKQSARRPQSPMINVVVTPEIISDSRKRDSSHCMIAEAVKKVVPDARNVSVDLQTIRFTDRDKGLRYIYLTPRSAQVALVQFDQGIEVEPFSMRLRGGHVIRKGPNTRSKEKNPGDGATGQQGIAAADRVRRQSMRLNADGLPVRVGGAAPPKMRDAENIPMSKRREFGLRALVR